ncbi:MAG TPA: ribosome maturation factor RimM [Williamwhitmania sp.]|nr:ribosome maturation factor RimM [Williamwhitmania sp.]
MVEARRLYVGRIAKEFGTNGELQLNLSPEYSIEENFSEPVFVEIDGISVPLFFKSSRPKGRAKAVVVFDDFESTKAAAQLIGLKLYAEGEESEVEEDEDDMSSFIGFTVIDTTKGTLGLITDFLDYPGNPLFAIDYNGVEVLIPVNDDLIVKVSEKKRVLTVDLPDGLLDLFTE